MIAPKAVYLASLPKTFVSSFYVSWCELSFVNLRFFRFLKIADIQEPHAIIKFCFLLGRSVTDAIDLLSAAYKEIAKKKKSKFLSGNHILNAWTCHLKTINILVGLSCSKPIKMLKNVHVCVQIQKVYWK